MCPAIFHSNVTSYLRRKSWRKTALACAEKSITGRGAINTSDYEVE